MNALLMGFPEAICHSSRRFSVDVNFDGSELEQRRRRFVMQIPSRPKHQLAVVMTRALISMEVLRSGAIQI